VLYGHVFRNAMLIVIAGFPAAFIGILFTGSLLIEVIFSLDGLGLLGFEAAINRDYPVMFGTLYIFTLLGLLLNLIGDLMYTVVDPRIDFEKRESECLPAPGTARWPSAARQGRRAGASNRRNRRGYWSLWIFLALFVLTLFAELIANDRPLLVATTAALLPGAARLPGDRLRRRVRPRPTTATPTCGADRGEGLDALAADPYSYDTSTTNLPSPAPSPPDARTGWAPTTRRATSPPA
jgi:hypothetical protein